ncbi:MAG: glycine cleavage system aminomethyltransferase GcvT, partial [Chloroflexota bacterium]
KGQVAVCGPDALAFLQWVASSDISTLAPGDAIYGMLTNPRGGVIDDIIVYRRPDADAGYMVCVNASHRDKDVAWKLRQQAERPEWTVRVEDISDRTGMIAIQGPNAGEIAGSLTTADLSRAGAFQWMPATVAGIPVMAARTGYTGEDGFEFYCDIARVGELWDALMAAGAPRGLVPVGLGARDTLRLEARMPLYGNELADDISPLEAGLGWAVALDKGPFVGRDPIAAMKEAGPPRRTVGFRLLDRGGSPRHGYEVAVDGRVVGQVTSGAMSPTLGENIGLALIERGAAGVGKPLDVIVRGKPLRAEQVKVPFYKRDR